MSSVAEKSVKAKSVAKTQKENVSRGVLFASAVLPAGIILWVVLWRMGVIASVVSFAIAFLAVWLYRKGSGGELSRKNVPTVVAIAVLGVVAAFLVGIISDGTSFYKDQAQMSEWALLGEGQFWSLMGGNFKSSEFWSSYTGDMLWALGFAALGMYGTVKDLFVDSKKIEKKS